MKIRKLLVANRGEIALRIIRSAKLLRIKTVAVYSEADARMAHVAAADEARLIGPAPARESYLNAAAIIAATEAAGADAVHPGYGFLSERPDFARAVSAHGLTFVGPPADAMAALGDKLRARQLAGRLGIPVVPGCETSDPKELHTFLQTVGAPILLKAAAGGGGRGMRVVERSAELKAALESAAREAAAAFGDGRLFAEKYLPHPRHVEVQILADDYGGVVALGERECSIQRRYQKIVEESPAPGIGEAIRARLCEASKKIARAAGYRNAGTVEFLVDDGQFYFLEANTRLQVEHPVTEMRFGCDLVGEQLRLASGEPVSEPGRASGHALECRVYAEDPWHGFVPATGEVLRLNLPAGPGVRLDTHLMEGMEISGHYDGLLAKLICWGPDRELARRRMIGALDDFILLGVRNNLSFLRDVVASEIFARAELSTHILDNSFARWSPADATAEAAAVLALLASEGLLGRAPPAPREETRRGRSPWSELRGFELGRER